MIKTMTALSILLFKISFPQADTLLTFSEIMFSPASGNNEFIEIYNLSTSTPVDLSTYKIKYYSSTPDQIVDAGSGTILQPQSYAVILENDYDIALGVYNLLVPSSALILKIGDNSFGSSGMANTSNRPLWLLGSADEIVDYYFYSANNAASYSDEKIIMNRDSLQTNWSNSLSANGTPGSSNSVTPLNNDLLLSSLYIYPIIPIFGNDVLLSAEITNKGASAAAEYSLEIFNDLNKNMQNEIGELIFSQVYYGLAANDSMIATYSMNSPAAGDYQIIARINYQGDQNPANNFIIRQFTVLPPGNEYNDILINEIMYAPSTGEPEWIELYNRTSGSINLKNWKLSDTSTSVSITTQDLLLNANSFIVISRDATITNFYTIPSDIIVANTPSLNNTGDAIVIKDINNVIIDSLYYLPEWGGNSGGKSLERVDYALSSSESSNWKTSKSIFRATPGNINSVTQKDSDILASDILFNPHYPIIGDNINLSAVLQNIGKNPAILSVNLYEDVNLDSVPDILIESITDIQLSAADQNLVPFNYLILNIQSKKAFYVKASFVLDQDTTNNYFYKVIEPGYPSQTIVVNEIMFAPLGGEPEWVELYNNSNKEINLNNWNVSDVLTTPVSINIKNDFIIPANGYVILSRDSSINNFHRTIPSPFLRINLPSLNNDRDAVVLRDNRGLTIDSVFYSNQWGGTNGYSIERISSTANSNNQFNWTSSSDIEQSTPGRINSVTPKEHDLSAAAILFSPRFPAIGNDVSIRAVIKNNGSLAAQNFITEFYIGLDSNNTKDFLLGSVMSPDLISGDSVLITCSARVLNLQNRTIVSVRIVYIEDQDTLNNYLEALLQPGYPSDIVRINEVMYNPADGNPEWVEFVNISADSVNLKNWQISDILPRPLKYFISEENSSISPDEIFVVARDTSFKFSNSDSGIKLFFSNFGSLGNNSDGVIIYDFRNALIDSLFYSPDWGGSKGYSLERISLQDITADSTNWLTSLDWSGSTPGRPNSALSIPAYNRNAMIINEIMYDPDSGHGEFIEFYNPNDDSINLGGWRIVDEDNNVSKLSESNFIIPPHGYFLLVSDSSVVINFNLQSFYFKKILNTPSLGLINSGELILLKDARAVVIDSVFYRSSWNSRNIISTKGKSLERINPSLNGNDPFNWSTSVDPAGGTPGRKNSIFAENINRSAELTINPNPFSPDNDGFEDFTIINYSLSQPTSQIRIKIFDSRGRLVRTLLNNQASGPGGSVIFDGLDDDGQSLRIGIYIIFLEALNDNSGVVDAVKNAVVVARKL